MAALRVQGRREEHHHVVVNMVGEGMGKLGFGVSSASKAGPVMVQEAVKVEYEDA